MEISPHPLEERRDDGAGDAGGAGVSGDKNAESNIDKPRQRILKVNFWWMLGLCCIYTASNIFDIFIWLDTSGFGADEPVWTEVQFIMEYETLPVDGEDLPLLPVFANAMKDELEQTTGVAEHNYELEIASVRKADVRNINGVIDVIQIGIASVRIRFFKPYQWGVQPASVMLQRLDEAAAKPGSVMFEPYINEGGTPAKFKTYNLNTASPLKQDTRTQGPRDGRPPTRVWLDVSGFVQLAGLITGCITAVLAAKMGWDMQMYDIGDIRLSTAGDAASGKYRMKWPLYVTITAAVLRLEVAAELFEARRSKKEQFGLIAVLIAGCVVQVRHQLSASVVCHSPATPFRALTLIARFDNVPNCFASLGPMTYATGSATNDASTLLGARMRSCNLYWYFHLSISKSCCREWDTRRLGAKPCIYTQRNSSTARMDT